MPCALVTGATGFAGQHLAGLLQRSGWDVVGTSRHAASGDDCPIEAVEISDVAGLARVLKAYRPKVVYHLAATVDTVETPDLVALYRTNVIGTAAVLEATRLTECVERVLLASSAFVYGPGNESGLPTPEDAPLRPVTPYGVSKVAAEAIGRQWVRDTGRDLVVTRAFQHTGPAHVGNFALADWARQLAAGGATLEVGNLGAVRDYLDVRDVVTAYESVMERGRAGEVYNVGSGRPVAMQDLLHGLVRAFGRNVTLVPRPERMRPSDEAKLVADVRRIHRETGWMPRWTLQETLHDLAVFASSLGSPGGAGRTATATTMASQGSASRSDTGRTTEQPMEET